MSQKTSPLHVGSTSPRAFDLAGKAGHPLPRNFIKVIWREMLFISRWVFDVEGGGVVVAGGGGGGGGRGEGGRSDGVGGVVV